MKVFDINDSRAVNPDKRKPLSVQFKKQWPTLLMLTPALCLVFLFSTVPLAGLYIAFTQFRIARGIFGSEFVGLANFIRFFKFTDDINHLLRNTLTVNILMIITNTTLAVAFAILIREIRFKLFAKTVQTASFFPYFISWVIAYSVVSSLFAVRTGAVNMVLVDWGVLNTGINLLGEAKYAHGLVIWMNVWKSIGYNSMIYITAMTGIPMELYEAATVDGAGRFRRIWHITLPGIIPTLSILIILSMGSILSSGIDFFFVFQNITNWSKMEMFDMYIYNRGLLKGDYSYATAVSIMKSIVSIALLMMANFTARKISGSSIF